MSEIRILWTERMTKFRDSYTVIFENKNRVFKMIFDTFEEKPFGEWFLAKGNFYAKIDTQDNSSIPFTCEETSTLASMILQEIS